MLSQGYGVTGTLDRWGQVDPVRQPTDTAGSLDPRPRDQDSPSLQQVQNGAIRPAVWALAAENRAWASAQFVTFHQAVT